MPKPKPESLQTKESLQSRSFNPDAAIERAVIIEDWRGRIRPGASIRDVEWAINGLLAIHERIPLIIGDILNEAEEIYKELFAQVVSSTGYAPGTLRNFAYMARRIAPPQRERARGLPLTAQYELARFKDPEVQDYWIDRILDEEMTRDEVRVAITEAEHEAYLREHGMEPPPRELNPTHWVLCPTCGTTVDADDIA